MYFVGSSPLEDSGHVNVSPKGHMETFIVVDKNTVMYLDSTGSGVETMSHLKENGRITIMFTSFDEKPNTVRLFGKGRVIERCTSEFEELYEKYYSGVEESESWRAIYMVKVHRCTTACGYSIPFFEYKGDRRQLLDYWKENGELEKYWAKKNAQSIDELQGVDPVMYKGVENKKSAPKKSKPSKSKDVKNTSSSSLLRDLVVFSCGIAMAYGYTLLT